MNNAFDVNFNPIEKIIYAHESSSFAFNCGLSLEFQAKINESKFGESILKLIERFPFLKSKIVSQKKVQRMSLNSVKLSEVFEVYNSEREVKTTFIDKFELSKKPAFKFILVNMPKSSKLYFYIHHTLVDGISQAFLLKELLYIYLNNEPSNIKYLRPSLAEYTLSKWCVFKLLFNKKFKYLLKSFSRKYDCLNIGDMSNESRQEYGTVNIEIIKEDYCKLKAEAKINKCTLFAYIVNSMCKSLRSTKPSCNKNIVLAMPINLRPIFKLKLYIGNLVTLTRLEVPASSFEDKTSIKFLNKALRSTINKEFLEYSQKILFGLNSIFSLKTLKRMFEAKTSKIKSFNSSMMVSYLKVDDAILPPQLKTKNISLMSAVFKSPGFGAVVIEYSNSLQITLTYCKPEYSEEIVNKFIEYFKRDLSLGASS